MKKFFSLIGILLFACIVGAGSFLYGRYEIFHDEHKTNSCLESNATNHWYVCQECGENVDEEEHNWDESKFISNVSSHWLECSDCGYKKNMAYHNFTETVLVDAEHGTEGVIQYKCSDCNYITLDGFSVNSVITEDVWEEVQDMSNLEYLQIQRFMYIDEYISFASSSIKDGDNILTYQDRKEYSIYSIEGDKYYMYRQDGYTEDLWHKTEVSQDAYDGFADTVDEVLFMSFSDLIYNEELQVYEYTFNDYLVQYYFIDGKLDKVVAVNQNMISYVQFSYDDIEVELPINYQVN